MQAFVIRIEQRRIRHQRVLARDADAARRSAQVMLRQGDRILSALPVEDVPAALDTEAGREARDWLLNREFLDLDGCAAWLRDWLMAARRDPDRLVEVNAALSMAGLRIRDDWGLAVGSPVSIPTLAEWTEGTRWAGAGLHMALGSIPGITRALLTFSGVRSRTTILPASELFDDA